MLKPSEQPKAAIIGAGFIGRAWAFALAAQGGRGVSAVLARLKQDFEVAMALTGCASVDEINGDVLVK